jgi:hypothetical protein
VRIGAGDTLVIAPDLERQVTADAAEGLTAIVTSTAGSTAVVTKAANGTPVAAGNRVQPPWAA